MCHRKQISVKGLPSAIQMCYADDFTDENTISIASTPSDEKLQASVELMATAVGRMALG